MSKNVLISAMLKLYFGTKIFCINGQNGILTHVLFDATTRRLTHLAIKQGRLFGKTVYQPFEMVKQATGDGIWLTCTMTELAAAPSAEGPGILLDPRTTVKGATGSGTLTLVAVQPGSGELAYIVVHNLVPGRASLLSEQYVDALAPGQISTSADAILLKTLPPYRSDSELQQEVDAIIFDLSFLRIDLRGISLRVLDSVLYMDGNISSTLRGELAQDQVAGVEGLLEIKNNLVGDDTLAGTIARALGQDARTGELPIGVYPQLGVVRLSGSVHNALQKAAATEIAKRFEGVRSVNNDLIIDPSVELLYVMSPSEGSEAQDITPGKFVRHTR
ncbi:MAG: BON domain-containing protein [Ktedonobacteraceae bacterium]